MSYIPTATELGREALEALKRSKEPPKEHFERLVRLGWINRRGQVTRLLGGDAEPEADAVPHSGENGHGAA
jgi:hypothetical protein